MKKTIVVLLFAVLTSGIFAQTTADEWYRKANEYRSKDDYANAITAYSEAIKIDNSHFRSYRRRGNAYFDTKKYDAAISDYSAAIKLDNSNYYCYYERGNAYYEIKNYNAAISDYSAAIKLDNSDIDVYWRRSFAYFQIKNYDAAISDCDVVIKSAPNFPTVYVLRADAYGVKGIYHKAVADWRKGFEKGFEPSGLDKSNKGYMWFCGTIYMEIVVNRFLGKSDVVAKYENFLKIVCDKNNVTRAEIEKYYRDNIRSLVSATVDEEFNNVGFLLNNTSTSHSAVLTRNPQTGQHILRYGGFYTDNETKTITANSPEALSSEMRKNTRDFDQTGIESVCTEAARIPAIVYADWKARGRGDALALLKESITNFYLDPNDNNYKVILGTLARYDISGGWSGWSFHSITRNSFVRTLKSLSELLGSEVNRAVDMDTAGCLSRYPADPRFDIFSRRE